MEVKYMYKDNYEIFERLRSYYEKNCAKLVFYGEKRLDNNKSCKMYFLDTTNDQELMNYKKLFQEYFDLIWKELQNEKNN